MPKETNWIPFYVSDYLKDTMHLTTEQHGAYMLLIMAYWVNQGPLASDDETLMAITRQTPAQWKKNKNTILRFFQHESDAIRHKRIEREIQDAIKRKKKGHTNAQKRWQKGGKSDAKPMLDGCYNDAKPMLEVVPNECQTDSNYNYINNTYQDRNLTGGGQCSGIGLAEESPQPEDWPNWEAMV